MTEYKQFLKYNVVMLCIGMGIARWVMLPAAQHLPLLPAALIVVAVVYLIAAIIAVLMQAV